MSFSTANFYETEGVKDIHFGKEITAGKYTAHMYALTDAEFFFGRGLSGV